MAWAMVRGPRPPAPGPRPPALDALVLDALVLDALVLDALALDAVPRLRGSAARIGCADRSGHGARSRAKGPRRPIRSAIPTA